MTAGEPTERAICCIVLKISRLKAEAAQAEAAQAEQAQPVGTPCNFGKLVHKTADALNAPALDTLQVYRSYGCIHDIGIETNRLPRQWHRQPAES